MHRWDFFCTILETARSTILFVKVSEFGLSLAGNDADKLQITPRKGRKAIYIFQG